MTSWQNLAISLVMLVTGLVLVAGDRLGVLSLDAVQKFWPLAVIVVGALELPLGKKQKT